MKKKKRRRVIVRGKGRDILRDMEQDRLRPLENELRVEHAMKWLHAAKRIIRNTAFIGHSQRVEHAEWLRRYSKIT